MPAFLWVAIIIIAILWLLTRLAAWGLRWGLRRYLHVELKIGRTGIFSLGKIHLGLPIYGLTLDIENVGLSSCIFNPDAVRKPLVICASDIRVQLDTRKANMDATQPLIQPSSKIKPVSQPSVNSTTRGATLDRLFTVCQYAGIRLQNVTVIIMKTLVPQCMLHVTGDKVTMDINVNKSSFQAMLNISGVVCRALQGTSEVLIAEEWKVDIFACVVNSRSPF